MSKLFYWQAWQQPYRFLFWVLLSFFLALAIAIVVLQVIGHETLLGWYVLTQESSFTVDYSIFSIGPFNYSLLADKKILSELYAGGNMPSTNLISSILVFIVFGCLLLYTTISTMFTRLGYLIAMGGLLAFLILFHVESVGFFGWNDTRVLVIVFVVILTPSYYLHAFRSYAGFTFRLLVLAAAMALLGAGIYYYGESQHPFINLLNYGILAPYLLVVVFIFSVAHEVVAVFVTIISSTENIENRVKIRHFLIISGIYLTNILLSFLNTAHYIDWQLFYINPFILLIISALLGIWGSRLRSSLYVGVAKQESQWPMMYLVLGIIALATTTSFMLALNDPFLKVLGDLIIYTHLAIGIAFVLYVLYNFIRVIEKGYSLSKVLYNPTNFPYFTYRIMGIIIVIGLFAIRGFDYPVWFSMGGFNNAKADMVLEDGFLDIAEAYYENGDGYAYRNHKSNYSLAMMSAEKEPAKAIGYFDRAKGQQPTSQTILNQANLENLRDDYYSALFTLQEGNEILPKNDHIYNNLAWQFAKLKVADSALYYLQLTGSRNEVINTNRLGFTAKYNKPIGEDSVSIFKNLGRAGWANASAHGYFRDKPELISADHMYDMVLFNNWLLTMDPQMEKGDLNWAKKIIDSTKNQEYQDQLLFSWSLASFRAGSIAPSIEGLIKLSYTSVDWERRAKSTLGKMYLSLGAYGKAREMFEEDSDGKLTLDLATSLLEVGAVENAFLYWQQVAQSEDQFMAKTALEILEAVYSENPILDTDTKRYLYARYNRFFIDESDESELLKQIETKDLRVDIALELADFYHQYGNSRAANMMLDNIKDLALSNSQNRQYIIQKALVNHKGGNSQGELTEFDKNYSFKPEEYLLENTLNHLAGMSLDSTDYIRMAEDNPFFPDAILIGASHFDNDADYFRSYSYLAKAVQLNPDSPKLLEAYILKALEVGLDQFAENSLYEFSQKFSGQLYFNLQYKYQILQNELNNLAELEPLE